MRATRPSFGFVGGHPPQPPAMGASPPWTPICPPPWAEGSPAFWVPLVAGLLMWATRPFFWFCGGTPPTTPRQGACAPWTPICPPPWAEGSPAFWVPLVAGLHERATRPFFWFCGGTPPTAPCHGGFAPLDPPFAHPRGLRVRRRFAPSEAEGESPAKFSPSLQPLRPCLA
jgi:hypothetical protein